MGGAFVVGCAKADATGGTFVAPSQPPALAIAPIATTPPPRSTTSAPMPLATSEPEPDGPPPPPARPVDPKLKATLALVLGENKKETWATIEDATVVVDKATGCVTESYPNPPILKALQENKAQLGANDPLTHPEVLTGIRETVGLGRRFEGQSHRFLLDMVWSPNGRHIVVELFSDLYRSDDGGNTFTKLDPVARVSRPTMAPDGKHLVYERCAAGKKCEYVSAVLDGSHPPVVLTSGQTMLLRMNAGDSTVYFWRSDTAEVCLDRFDLEKGTRLTSVCQPLPSGATGPWPGHEWQSVSPNGKYGVVKWEEGRKNLAGVPALTYVVSVVDLDTNRILREVTDVEGEIDDEGNFVARSMSEGGGDHTYLFPLTGKKKLLGNASMLAYYDKVATLAPYRVGNLGSRKCDLLKFVRVP